MSRSKYPKQSKKRTARLAFFVLLPNWFKFADNMVAFVTQTRQITQVVQEARQVTTIVKEPRQFTHTVSVVEETPDIMQVILPHSLGMCSCKSLCILPLVVNTDRAGSAWDSAIYHSAKLQYRILVSQ